jgi:phosphoribosylformylglycinamidine cyclo-ligase
MRVLCDAAGFGLSEVEDTWNMGIGMIAMVDAGMASIVTAALMGAGHQVWQAGVVEKKDAQKAHDATTSAKGVEGGSIRLVGAYADSSSSSSSAHLST